MKIYGFIFPSGKKAENVFGRGPAAEVEAENAASRHQKLIKLRSNSRPLEDIPYQLFLRLVGLSELIPPEHLLEPVNKIYFEKFVILRAFIDDMLNRDHGEDFARCFLGDYVHNLHLILTHLLPLNHLKTNIHNIREEYRCHAGQLTYNEYLLSANYKKIAEPYPESFSNKKAKRNFELKVRADYCNLINEIRRLKIYEAHVEDTRSELVWTVVKSALKTASIPLAVISVYLVMMLLIPETKYPNFSMMSQFQFLIGKSHQNSVLKGLVLLALSGYMGLCAASISTIQRVLSVQDNNQLTQNIVAFKYSEKAIRFAPAIGLVFAIILSLLFAGRLISGKLFPEFINLDWEQVLFVPSELAKWLTWSFIAGFSERLVPDMIDTLSKKVKEGTKGKEI